jgi:hypothetical protein
MSKQIRFRRGTTAQHATFTGSEAEVTVDTTKSAPVVHDGVTAGGVPLLREDRPRGWTRTEIITTSGAVWTKNGKTDLKRIRVTAYGGGAGGLTNGGAGGSGGIGMVVLEAASLSTNVTVTIGSGGASGANGGTTSFGSFITATGGTTGAAGSFAQNISNGGAGGTATGTGVFILGGQGGTTAFFSPITPPPAPVRRPSGNVNASRGGGQGGGRGVDATSGIRGAGGGHNQAGRQGCVIIEEIYGMV